MSTIKEGIMFRLGLQQWPIWAVVLVRCILAVGLLTLIYNQVAQQAMTQSEFVRLIHARWQYGLIGLVLALMFFNWLLEALKWKRIVSVFQPLNLRQALVAVLSGVALAIVTPGRIGEYGGRLVNIDKEHRTKALLGNAVSSLAQNIANISIGLIGVACYAVAYLEMGSVALVSMLSLIVPMVLVSFLIIYRLDLVSQIFEKLPMQGPKKWFRDHSAVLAQYTASDISILLLTSYFRYAIYTTQYSLLILICGVTSHIGVAFVGVTVIFLIQTGIPLPPMLSVLARGEVAIWVWSVVSTAVVPILMATFLLWLINLVVPAVCGVGLLWGRKRGL